MKKIGITEGNYKLYNRFLKIKLSDGEIGFVLVLLEIVNMLPMALLIAQINDALLACCALFGYCFTNVVCLEKIPKTYKNFKIKKFQEKYPNFDTSIDVNELKKELKKFDELSKIPKDIKKQEEECLSNLQSNNFKQMSNTEKIAFLEQTKEILMQAERYEGLTQDKINADEVGYQKKIGSINN